jgi:hypothetical protein
MNLRIGKLVVLLAFISLASSAGAANVSVVPKLGTLGVGLDLGLGWSEWFTTRLVVNGGSLSGEVEETDVTYDTDIDFRTAGLLLDFHPFSGVFRLTAGAYYNGNEVNMVGKPTGGSFEFNGNTYPASDVGSLNGKGTFDNAAPYVGIGFSNAGKKGWKFALDVGALYQNSPLISLDAVCGPGVPVGTCATLQADVQAEEARLQEELKDYKWYPVFSVGIGYSF